MTRKLLFLIAFIIAGNFLFAQKKGQLKSELLKEWILVKTIDSSGLITDEFSKQDHLSLFKEDQLFHKEIMGVEVSGKWELEDSLLSLHYNLEPVMKEIDSIVYEVSDDTPIVIFYSEGVEVTRMRKDQLSSKRTIVKYDIITCNQDSLVLLNGGKHYYYALPGEMIIAADEEGGFGFKSIYRGIIGLMTVLFLAWLMSANRRAISWKLVVTGLLVQLVIAVSVLKVPLVQNIIEFVGQMFIKVLDFTKVGSEFLFGDFLNVDTYGFIFAFQILPTIIFFAALSSIFFYYGIIQKVVYGLAWVLTKTLKISGAEGLSASGNIFLGQTESPLLIKEYLEKMNRSEIMLVMVGGMATIAGGVLAIYIGLLGGENPVERLLFAKHLITASVMAAPGAVVAAKMLIPQTESIQSEIKISKDKIGTNILEAITNGTTQGLRLAVNVGAMLLVFLALIAMLNFIMFKIGAWTDLNPWVAEITNGQYEKFSLEFILGYAFTPVAWAIGVPAQDMTLVARLFGEKIILNEMIAYISLKDMIDTVSFSHQKSVIIATYLLCGFANFSSIGIQLGGIGALAPGKKTMLSQLGFRALIGGALASLLSATIVGMILG